MKEFIINEVKKMREVYKITPDRIISDYRKEKREIDGYKGRQILELIQNADDASEIAEKKSVYVKITKDYLSISNNGEAFTREGIKSLLYSDLSPKAQLQNKIGNKGTGFRSVLSWSEEIYIKSKELSVGFSAKFAEEFLEELMETEQGVKNYIEEKKENESSIAVLVVPKWMENISCIEGFDTTITLKLLQDAHEDILSQLNNIDCETLLFLKNIEELTIQFLDRTVKIIKKVNTPNYVEILLLEDDVQILKKCWNLKKKLGSFNGKNYEIAIAYTDKLDDNKKTLYSYFKTDVAFPFPAIIHGTFNLDASRNHLLKNNSENIYLIEQLGDLLIETSLEMAKSKIPDYGPLLLLCFHGEFSKEVEEMGFEKEMIKKIRRAKIFPSINGKYISFNDHPKFYQVPFSDILPKQVFPELLVFTDKPEINQLLNTISEGKKLYYKYEEFCDKLNKIANKLKPKEKVEIIKYMLKIYGRELKAKGVKVPQLIIDTEGEIVKNNEIVFIKPKKNEALKTPPAFTNIKFLNDYMYRLLKTELQLETPRELVNALSSFGIREYAFENVANRIISRLSKRANSNSVAVKNDIIKTVKWFYSVYKDLDDKIKGSKQKDLYLINRQGNVCKAQDLFLGEDYGNNVCENLLGTILPENYLIAVEDLGTENENKEQLSEFLCWLGVNKFPQITEKEVEGKDKKGYIEFIKESLKFPLIIGDCVFNSLDEFNYQYKNSVIKVAHIELLEAILEKVPTLYILDWLIEDKKLRSILEKGNEENNKSTAGFRFGYKENLRYLQGDKLPAFILWKLMNSNWIEVGNERVSPKKCCLSRYSGISLSPFIEYPNLNEYVSKIKERKLKNKKKEIYEEILIKAGVASDFSELDENTIYAILKALPQQDPEGKKAKAIYRYIVQNAEIDEWNIDKRTFEDFISYGMVFATVNNEKKYLPVSQVYYLDDKTVCRAVVESFPLLDLDKRKGKEKVERILGVKPFKKGDFELIDTPVEHLLNKEMRREFKSYLPYMYCYRYDKDFKFNELKKLKKLEITLCTSIKVAYNNKEAIIEDFEYVENGRDTVYIKVPGKYKNVAELKGTFEFTDVIAEIITSTLDVEGNRKDYRTLFEKSNSDRKKVILSDFDNPDLLRDVKHLMSQEYDEKDLFWADVIKAVKHEDEDKIYAEAEIQKLLQIEEDFLFEFNGKVDFNELNRANNGSYFIKLFSRLQIDIETYNKVAEEKVSLVNYYNSQLTNILPLYKNKYKSYLYEVLSKENIGNRKEFKKKLAEYDGITIDFFDTISINVKELLFAKLDVNLDNISEKDLDIVYFENKAKLKDTINIQEAELNEVLNNDLCDSLMYFGDLEEIKKYHKNYVEQQLSVQKAYSGEKLEDINNKVQENNYKLEEVRNTKAPQISEAPNSKQKKNTSSGFNKGKNNENIGLKGERFVYCILKKNYKEVKWVSENAKIDGINSEGTAGLGYDMTYIDENGRNIYVEVKTTTSDEEAFYMSSNEIEFAEKKSESYELIFVTNINEESRNFYTYKELFQYKEDETRYNNSNFTLTAKEYRVKTERV